MKPKILLFAIFLLISVIFLSSYQDTFAYPDEEIQISVTTDKASYKPGEILTIKGAGAHSYSIWAKIISPQGDELIELKFLAPKSGEFSTAWIIPRSITQGIYTIEDRDVIQKTTTNFQIQSSTEPAQKLYDPKRNPDTNFTAATFADTYRDIILQVKGKRISFARFGGSSLIGSPAALIKTSICFPFTCIMISRYVSAKVAAVKLVSEFLLESILTTLLAKLF